MIHKKSPNYNIHDENAADITVRLWNNDIVNKEWNYIQHHVF